MVDIIITRQAKLELRRTIEVAQVDSADTLALQFALNDGITCAGRHVDVPELRCLQHIGKVGHDVVAAVDGIGDTSFHARVEEVVRLILAEGVVGESTALPEALAPNLRELSLKAQVDVEVADQQVDLVPNTAVVAVSIVVVADDVADVSHMVRVVEVGLAFVRLQVLGILINIVVIITT